MKEEKEEPKVYEITEDDQPPELEQVDIEKERLEKQAAPEEKSAEVKAQEWAERIKRQQNERSAQEE